MSADWQISAGFLAELARPALYASAALASACVLADSPRHFGPRAVALWTAFALFLPHVTVPLYLAARLYARTPTTPPAAAADEAGDEDKEGKEANDPSTGAGTDAGEDRPVVADAVAAAHAAPDAATDGVTRGVSGKVADEGADGVTDTGTNAAAHSPPAARLNLRAVRRHALPLLYAAALLAAGALYFYADYRSADAHLARAQRAKLDRRDERALMEYRAALRLEDDPHVRKLLGVELSRARRWEEALAELRAAEAGGEPDDALAFHMATALAELNRPAEAADEYGKFLRTRICAQPPPDRRCETARRTLRIIGNGN